MSQLSDTQLVILSTAIQRVDRNILPLPERLKGGAAGKVVNSLIGNETYISRALRLTLLAPDVVDAILNRRQPEGMTLPVLMERVVEELEATMML